MEECWYAFTLAVVCENYMTPEMSFECLVNGRKLKKNSLISDADFEDMVKLREDTSYKEIGKMYGLTESNAFHRIKRYKGMAM